MKIAELEDRLEDVNTELRTIYETINLIYLALAFGNISAKEIMHVISEMVYDTKRAAEEVENLVNETIAMRVRMEKL